MRKFLSAFSIIAVLAIYSPYASADAIAPKDGACGIYLDGSPVIHRLVSIGAGSTSFLILNGGVLDSGGGSNTYGIRNGGEVISAGASQTVYLKSGATYTNTGGANNIYYYEAGATITDTSGTAKFFACDRVVIAN